MASRFAFTAVLASVVLGCGSQGSTAGKVTVLLKDAPAELSAAVVTIAEVDLVGSSGTVVLTTTPTTTDLMTLANDVATLVDGAAIPAGAYSQLRFVITGGYLEAGGTIYASSPTYEGLPPGAVVGGPLRMPSYDQSGLKVILPEGFTVGADSTLLVDFDVSQSFGHEAGNSGAWVMHPTVKATELSGTGAIDVTLQLDPTFEGDVAPRDFLAVLTPVGGSDSVVVPLVDQDGTARASFQYLFPGEYTLSFQAPAGVAFFSTDPVLPLTVTVTPGQTAVASFTLLSAAPLE